VSEDAVFIFSAAIRNNSVIKNSANWRNKYVEATRLRRRLPGYVDELRRGKRRGEQGRMRGILGIDKPAGGF